MRLAEESIEMSNQQPPESFPGRRITRRQLLGAASVAAAATGPWFHRASAQTPTASFTRNASITSWGFGAEQTNPMAFSRIDAFKKAYPTIKLELVPQFDDQKLLTA